MPQKEAMHNRIFILATLATGLNLTHAAAQPADPKTVAHGETFSVPIPKGFSIAKNELMNRSTNGGVILVADQRADPSMFLGSIAVVKILPGQAFDPGADLASCKNAALGVIATLPAGATLKSVRIKKTLTGDACQWEVQGKSPTRGATGTVMYKARDNAWVVTCNFDTNDMQAQAACNYLIAGWKFD